MEFRDLLTYGLPPITGAVGWFGNRLVGKKKRDNDFIADLQGTINKLVDEYTEALNSLTDLRKQNAELLAGQAKMQLEVAALRKENLLLKNDIEKLNNKIATIKSYRTRS